MLDEYNTLIQSESQLFRFWNTLNEAQQKILTAQLHCIHLDILKKQQQLIQSSVNDITTFEAFNHFAFSGNLKHQIKGKKLIEKGRLGCLLLAGGQGSRLQHKGPKGTYPISVIKNKSLFQLCAEKIHAASVRAGRPLNLAIMTAPDNDLETREFFQAHHFFGLHSSQISFFVQGTLPFLDAKGHLFLQDSCHIAQGSDGNGHSLLSFAQSGILNQWMEKGIEYMHVILVDNPLADPFDAELLGFHYEEENEITLKCTEKSGPEEKVGLLVKKEGRCKVIEYSEMPEKERRARQPDGRLKHCCANLSLFCFSLPFIQHVIESQSSLPLHKAWKATAYADEQGIARLSNQPNAWKFETFIFDWLLYSEKISALIFPREQCFAPLKNAIGADSPETVREAIQEADIKIIQSITGLEPPEIPFELAAEFYYPTPELLKNWKNKRVLGGYIRPLA